MIHLTDDQINFLPTLQAYKQRGLTFIKLTYHQWTSFQKLHTTQTLYELPTLQAYKQRGL